MMINPTPPHLFKDGVTFLSGVRMIDQLNPVATTDSSFLSFKADEIV